jgi:hypothetical protein
MKKFLHDNSLSIVLFALFFLFLVGLSITGHRTENEELLSHSQPLITYLEYLRSGGFAEAVFENWESEFLQMGALVLLTIWLHQKGASDSKKLRGSEEVDTHSRYSILKATTWSNRKKAIAEGLYANSLTIVLFGLFILSFILHAVSGTSAANEEALQHGEETLSTLQYIRTSQFWFESFQNWQSEFLAVGSLIVLSIFLRQRKSPESKPVGSSNSKTGS